MMPFVYIGGEYIGEWYTWNEFSGSTWTQLLIYKWGDFGFENHVLMDTFEIYDDINHRATANFSIIDVNGKYDIKKGQDIQIYLGGDLIFGGIVDTVKSSLVGSENSFKRIDVSGIDYTVIAERRVISYVYNNNIFAGQIVQNILNNYLSEESIEVGEILNGEELERAVFPLKTIKEIFDTLAAISGYIWFIDYDKKLYFIERTTFSSEFDITDYTKLLSFELSEGNPNYRNIQYVIGPKVLTDTLMEYFKGDGNQKTFTVGYPIKQEPTIYVNDVIQDVGIKGVEAGKSWYWNLDDNTITQDQGATPLSSSDILKVEYIGSFPLIIKVTNHAELTSRKLTEGFGTGKYERVDMDTNMSDYEQGLSTARGILNEYGTIGYHATYTTTDKITSGTLQNISLSAFNVSTDFLITSVRVSCNEGLIFYEVEASSGPVDESWEDIFCKIAKNAKEKLSLTMSSTDVVQGLEEFTKVWQWNDLPNPFRQIYPDSTTPSDSYFPCFATGDKFVYCALYTNGNEFFRKPITYQTDDGTTLTCITVFNVNEGNEYEISHVGLFGGDTATNTLGSGIELCKFPFVKQKSELETLQVNIYNVRGWV